MKYSQQQQLDIERRYANLTRSIDLTNLRSKGIQSIVVDKQIPLDLLDQRNTNDIENDEFARRSLFNKYATEILKSGNIYELQQRLIKDNLDRIFIDYYPKILIESKTFRRPTTDNVYRITLRLYNKMEHEENLFQNDENIQTLLETISNNLSSIQTIAQSAPQRQNIIDQQNKIDALLASTNIVGSEIQLIQDLFKKSYGDVMQNLITIIQNSQIDPSNPNKFIVDLSAITNAITQNNLTISIQNQNGNNPLPPQLPLPSSPVASLPPTPDELLPTVSAPDPNTVKSPKEIEAYLTYMVYTANKNITSMSELEIKILKDYAEQKQLNKKLYSKILRDVFLLPQNDSELNKIYSLGTKVKMYESVKTAYDNQDSF